MSIMDLDLKIKYLPKEVKRLALHNQKMCGNQENEDALLMDPNHSFNFEESPQGSDFWVAILEYDYIKAIRVNKTPNNYFVFNGDGNVVSYYFEDGSDKVYNFNTINKENIIEATSEALKYQEELRESGYEALFGYEKDIDPKHKEVIFKILKKMKNKY